ncbi:MAG TPA: glycosyltransferase [Bryobacteraceae bacterium]|nr:glycosyltransferase [Bryobacteraceae bacterium]
MNVAFFVSSLVSAYWNGAATYYRGIGRAMYERGHRLTFFEPDAYQRQQHRDIEDPDWAKVVVYPATEEAVYGAIREAGSADLIVKASGVGVFDELLEAELLELKKPSNLIVFWDVDAPATLERVLSNQLDPFAPLVRRYDAVLTYGGGCPVIDAYRSLGARECIPIYNALDPATHHPVKPDYYRFSADLAFLGNRLPDREARVEEFFLKPAERLPSMSFLLGGAGWDDKPRSANIKYLNHVYTHDHNAFNVTPRAVLNISRDSMARYGFSPATRVFEAAGAGACLITDFWEGIDMFLEPGREALVARSGDEVVESIESLSIDKARKIGQAAYKRVLSEHTYAHRAAQIDAVLDTTPVSMEVTL